MNIEQHVVTPKKKAMAVKAIKEGSDGVRRVIHEITLNQWLIDAGKIALQYHLVKGAIVFKLPLEVRIKGTEMKATCQPEALIGNIVSVKEHQCKIEGGKRWIYYYNIPQVLVEQMSKNQLKLF